MAMEYQLIEPFKLLYTSLGLISSDGLDWTLRQHCEFGVQCWGSFDQSCSGFGISRPWIGANYRQSKVLVVGINMNDCGGWDAYYDFIDNEEYGARKELRNGVYWHLKSRTYRGTMQYYRIAHLGFAVQQICSGTFSGTTSGDPREIADGFDWIAYTNHVKCSPPSERSKPSTEMWQQCGPHVLKKEIGLLDPKYIILLGNDNFAYFCDKVLDTGTRHGFPNFEHAQYATGCVNGASLQILGIPHPSFGADKAFHSVHSVLAEIMRS